MSDGTGGANQFTVNQRGQRGAVDGWAEDSEEGAVDVDEGREHGATVGAPPPPLWHRLASSELDGAVVPAARKHIKRVLPIFLRLVYLPLDKFQASLARILQGSAHTGPALTPVEALVVVHEIIPERDGVALKKRTVFTQHVLERSLSHLVDKVPLPLLLMRTVIQAIDAFPTVIDLRDKPALESFCFNKLPFCPPSIYYPSSTVISMDHLLYSLR